MRKIHLLSLSIVLLLLGLTACKKIGVNPDDGSGDKNLVAAYSGYWEGTEARLNAALVLDSTIVFREGDFVVRVIEGDAVQIKNATFPLVDNFAMESEYEVINDSTISFEMQVIPGGFGKAKMKVTSATTAEISFNNTISLPNVPIPVPVTAKFQMIKKQD